MNLQMKDLAEKDWINQPYPEPTYLTAAVTGVLIVIVATPIIYLWSLVS